jgi:hypothetical protein
MNYILWISGQEHGPYTLEQIQQSIDDGGITPQQTARIEDGVDWKPIQQIARLKHPTPKKPEPKLTMASAAPTTTAGANNSSRKCVTAYLSFIRANTCYGVLRTIIEISFVFSLIAALGYTLVAGIGSLGGNGILAAFTGLLVIFLLVAARQSALLLIDIADTLLHEHSKGRNGQPPI